jgi:glycosyltransferase involved in cell wall biosynthesis
MHILIVVLHRPEKPTGVCRHAANLANCLADRAEVSQVTLVTGAWQLSYFKAAFSLPSKKINLLEIEIKNTSLARNLWFLNGLPKLAHHLQPDLVHLSFPLPFLRSRFSCPVVATIHDLYPFEMPENFGKQAILNQLILRACVNQSSGLTCVSQTTLDRLRFYFPKVYQRKPTTVVYNYVDFGIMDLSTVTPANLKAMAKDASQVFSTHNRGVLDRVEPSHHPHQSGTKPFLLCVAQHRKNKNLDALITAFAQLRHDRTLSDATQLVIVGSAGPETAALHQHVRGLELETAVHFISSISDHELCTLYQQCCVFVIASAIEGFCLPLAEALHLGCRVVCSNIPVLKEIGSAQCTYFELQGDRCANLAQAIAHALHQPPPEKNTDERFSKAQAANQLLAFYSQVM